MAKNDSTSKFVIDIDTLESYVNVIHVDLDIDANEHLIEVEILRVVDLLHFTVEN